MRVLIVDGYNVLHSSERYRSLLDADPEMARAALVGDVAGGSVAGTNSIVVFDGGANPGSDGAPHHLGGVIVLFSPYGSDADAVVEALARRSRERGEEVVVVTSDAATQWTVMGEGVARMSAREFVSLLEADSSAWREHTPSGSGKVTLEARIDPSVADKMARWARGQD